MFCERNRCRRRIAPALLVLNVCWNIYRKRSIRCFWESISNWRHKKRINLILFYFIFCPALDATLAYLYPDVQGIASNENYAHPISLAFSQIYQRCLGSQEWPLVFVHLTQCLHSLHQGTRVTIHNRDIIITIYHIKHIYSVVHE